MTRRSLNIYIYIYQLYYFFVLVGCVYIAFKKILATPSTPQAYSFDNVKLE